MKTDRIRGALLGTAVGDALGMPIEGMSHQNVRTYYKGIKEYRDDERRGDLEAGQWTDDTQMTFALVRALTRAQEIRQAPELVADEYVALRSEARRWGPTTTASVDRLAGEAGLQPEQTEARATDGAAMRASPLGVWWSASGAGFTSVFGVLRPILQVTHRHPDAVAAGIGQAFAVKRALELSPETFDTASFWRDLLEVTRRAEVELGSKDKRCSSRLEELSGHLHQGVMPLDLQDICDGTGVYAHEAWPFATAMFARAPHLVEATLLSTVNVGGDADTTGAMTGALLGAVNGWRRFPQEWRDGLERREQLEQEADAFVRKISALR